MEPDVDPPMLPLQGVRLRRPSPSNEPSTATPPPKSSSNNRTPRPAPRRPQQPLQKGDVSRLPASARSATRVASHVKRPSTATKPGYRITPIPLATPVPAKSPPFQHTRGPPPTRASRTAPLLPLSERKQSSQNAPLARARTNSELDRFDITPDGGSAGREGRTFAVSNVGNNGRIYLRYVLPHPTHT